MRLTSDTRLGTYEIVAPLGAGGMGEVYQAKDTKLGRDVALKILPASFTNDPERVARFRREAQVLASLNHPHIAQIYGLEEANGAQFLVLELVDGESLDKRIARGRISVDEALGIAKQTAEALEAAHEKGIIHRDLKPANIALTKEGSVKVLDFGLAKAVETTSGLAEAMNSPTITSPAMMTGIGVILGTAAYMSPEQAKGRVADKRSDVWAFGCVLFEMLTGKRAFEGGDVSDTIATVLKGEAAYQTLPATAPPFVRTIVEGCLQKDRTRRIGDISTAIFLMNQQQTIPVAVSPAAARSTRLRHALLIAASMLLGATGAGTLVWKSTPVGPLPVSRFVITLPPGQQLLLTRSPIGLSPDGTNLVYNADGRLYIRSLSEFDARPLSTANQVSAALNPVFSPDSRWMAFWSDQAIKRIAVAGGAAITICEATTVPNDLTWTRDGILFSQAPVGISRVSANGGKPELLVGLKTPERLVQGSQLLPDGRSLLFTVAEGSDGDRLTKTRIVVQSLSTGTRKVLIEGGSDARYVPTGHLAYTVGGTLFAAPFDLAKLALTATPVPVVEGVRRASAASTGTSMYAFSNTGSLAFVPGPTSSDYQDLILFDRKGSSEALRLPPGPYEFPRVSPDGKRIAFQTSEGKETNISIYDLSGGSSIRRLTFGGNNRFPIWSADGQRVAFQSDRDGDAAIFWQSAEGGAAERLTKPERGISHVPESWSPSGDTFLFNVSNGLNTSLWMFSLRDRIAVPFDDVRASGLPTDAVFSPDGRWVAYQTGTAFGAEGTTFVQPFPPNGTTYQIARGGRPMWSRDGKELFYVPAPGRFLVVSVKADPTFTFTPPMPVPRGFGVADPAAPRTFDITSDGRFLGVGAAGPGAGTQTGIHVVLNWFEELKARVPTR